MNSESIPAQTQTETALVVPSQPDLKGVDIETDLCVSGLGDFISYKSELNLFEVLYSKNLCRYR